MKTNKLVVLLLVAVMALVATLGFAACQQPEQPQDQEYTVTFDSVGGGSVSSQTVKSGEKATEPTAPEKAGFDFLGWFNGETKYDFNTPVTQNLTLTAKWQAVSVKTYTVTFNSNGGSSVASQSVNENAKAQKPADPTKEGYDFFAWYYNSEKYDFDTPVTKDITLVAMWDEKVYTVTFDSDGGSDVASVDLAHGQKITKPQNPEKEGFYFEGWFVGESKYDFETPLTAEITLKAHWSSKEQIDSAFLAALAADYSNFTSLSKITEDDLTDTYTFKQTSALAFWQPPKNENGEGIYEDHIVVFDDNGKMLAMYYLHNGEWLKSGLITYADFVVALYLNEIELDDVAYSEGAYRVYDECVASVVYALFRSNEDYENFFIEVENGRISKVYGDMTGMKHEQTFFAFGETQIDLPDQLPAVVVDITTKNRELEEGAAIDLAELISFMFTVKVEGHAFAVTADMVDIGELNVTNPVAGTYTITLSFDTWDGETHSQTAILTISTPQGDETFAEIFAKDYSNVSITYTTTTFRRVGEVYTSSSVANAYYFVESDNSLTKYVVNDSGCTETKNNWFILPRLEMLFALSADLFEQVEDTDTYVAKNNEAIVELLNKTTLTNSMIVNPKRDYSITLTVELGRVTKIAYSYYSLSKSTTATAGNGSLRNLEYTLSEFGTTTIEVPDSVKEKRDVATANQVALVEDKRYAA